MKLADFILKNMERFLQEWEDFANTLPPAKDMDKLALRDHAKALLESIVKDISTPKSEKQLKKDFKGKKNVSLFKVQTIWRFKSM